MRKNWRTIWTLALAVALLLTGCVAPGAAPGAPQQSSGSTGAGSDEKIELRIAWWGSQDRHDRTIKAIELFESMHPNIDITYEFSGWDDHWTKMATQATGNNLPDIMQQDYARLEEWVSRGLLMSLDPFVEDGTIDLSEISATAIDGGRVDGTLYAINLGTNSQVIAIDKDAFAAAGLEIPAQDWTWEEFEQTVLALHEKLGIWGIGPGLSDQQIWKSYFLGRGMWGYNDEGTALGYTDDQIFVDYLNMLLRLQEAGAIPDYAEEVARYIGQSVEAQPIVTKEAAMGYFHSNQIVAVQTAAGEDRNFYLNHLPRPEGGQPSNYLKPSQFFSITSQAKHPKEAAMFIDFFTNDIEANKILMAERGVPISPDVRAALEPLLGKAQREMFEFIGRIEADSSPVPPADPPGHADVIANVYTPLVIEPVLYGQITPEEAAATFRAEAEPVLAKAAGQ